MGTLSLRIPKSLHEQIRQLAQRDGISINQFVASAASEKMSALLTEEYITARARKASLKKFQKVLKKVPDVEPEDYDRM
ncbi:MAG: type II toxin-antitoxin system HicB family antitoxin [Desulfobacterota bacterium]|nr:type II toxin-antitoxin system HicB family antitoxin [Thermodesulfobacteriota bacterium]